MKKDEKQQIKDDIELKESIARETVTLLYSAVPGSIFATIVISAFLSAVLWQFSDDSRLILWFVAVAVINLARIGLYKQYQNRNKKESNAAFWDKSFYVLLILNGLCFSAIGAFFLPDAAVAYHYFPIMVLIGLATGAVATLSFSMRNITTYFMLLVFPILINELLLNTFISYSVAVLVSLSIIFSLVNAKKIYQTSIENITLNFHSEKHTQELIESRNAAIKANSAKTNFISMISHELRTPLNGILGFAQLLKMSDAYSLNKEENENIQGIIDSGGHLLSLIEELLELSKIEAHKLDVTIGDVSLSNVLEESVAIINPVAAGFNISIINNIENNYLIKADNKRLKQVFINLISNAIKYNHVGGQIEININEPCKEKIRVSVSDTGNGLSKEQVKGLFQPFQRYDDTKEGLGLGLYITQNIIELMNGQIGVESEQGKGSTFWFELDVSEN